VFGYDRHTTLADIKDGVANTLLIAETAQVSGSWFQGGPATVRGLDQAQKPYIGPGRQFGGLHRGVAGVAMADGSVRMVSDSISPEVFEALSTMAGGERLPATW
jgi:prepilin-type processing-associated H-X9-DG protein